MADLHEKMVKLWTVKGEKSGPKRARVQKLKIGSKGVGSEGSTPSSEASPVSSGGPAKKQKIQVSSEGRRVKNLVL